MNLEQSDGIEMLCDSKWNRLIPKERYEVSEISPFLEKEEDGQKFSASPSSVCTQWFRCVTMYFLGVKSLVEHDNF